MKYYRYILFDWDGNLAKTLDIWLKCLRLPLEKRGYFLKDAEIGADFGAFKERMRVRGLDDVDEILSEADKLAAKMVPEVELYPDSLEVLESLHNTGKKLALVTTSEHLQIDPLLKKYGMRRLFDAIVCGDDVEHHKPHAEPIERALDLLGGSKELAVMVGDSDKDILAAANAGVDSILFYPAAHRTFYSLVTLQKLHPTFVVQDLREIISLV